MSFVIYIRIYAETMKIVSAYFAYTVFLSFSIVGAMEAGNFGLNGGISGSNGGNHYANPNYNPFEIPPGSVIYITKPGMKQPYYYLRGILEPYTEHDATFNTDHKHPTGHALLILPDGLTYFARLEERYANTLNISVETRTPYYRCFIARSKMRGLQTLLHPPDLRNPDGLPLVQVISPGKNIVGTLEVSRFRVTQSGFLSL
ncbi:uncharacterized protein LOC117171874 [Belonocnema kinseyi]|uniref:uncharacterized protein LOC117171874 n=1 Tax=Belonocnema kinseyi TaxID=2817044 RepID=UPI00143CE3E3|nr:uncharacterized protein LOC117171874 [Belonocnema kinseyi]